MGIKFCEFVLDGHSWINNFVNIHTFLIFLKNHVHVYTVTCTLLNNGISLKTTCSVVSVKRLIPEMAIHVLLKISL